MGKKSPAPPPPPDYAAAAQAQGAANLDAARLTARLSNPNISTPLGGQRVTFGRNVFDQAGYEKAMADYQKQLDAYNQAKAGGLQTGPGVVDDYNLGDLYGGGGLYGGFKGGGYGAAPVAPTKEQFTTLTDKDTPYIEQYLTPEAQKTLEAQQRVELALAGLGEQGIGIAQKALGQPFQPNLPGIQLNVAQPRNVTYDVGKTPDVNLNPDLFQYGRAGVNVTPGQIAQGPDLMSMGRAGTVAGDKFGLAQGGVDLPKLQMALDLQGIGNIAYAPQAEQLQRQLDVSNLAQMPVNAGTTAQGAIMSRLAPQLQQERSQLQTQLVNQGIPPGSEAYRVAMTQQNQRENDLLNQAAVQGINPDMAARAQGLGEQQTLGSFANQAANQVFQNRLAQQQAQNQAQQQAFGQRVQSGEFGNAAQLAYFGAGLQNQDAANRAIAQNFNQALESQRMANAALSQNQQAALQQQAAANAAQQLGFGQQMDFNAARNAAIAANQQTGLSQQQAMNAAQNQAYNQALQNAQFGNAAQNQAYNQALQNAQFFNTAQQQSLAQQLALRNQPLNEIAALMSGSQVQMPQFQGYTGANVAAAPVFNAATAQDAAAMQRYGIQANQAANNMSGLFGLAGAVAGAPAGGFLSGLFRSDRRLKSNIERVGTHRLGIGIYEYDIDGRRERGVMADEVETVMPNAVVTGDDGYKRVNYRML